MTPVRKIGGMTVVTHPSKEPTPVLRSLRPLLVKAGSFCLANQRRQPRAVDLGCGNGRNGRWLKSLGYEVLSLDQHPPEGGFEADLRKPIPVFDCIADVVLMQFILMFLEPKERDSLIDEAFRMLDFPGILVVEMMPVKSGLMDNEAIARCNARIACRAESNSFKVRVRKHSLIASNVGFKIA